LAPRGPYSKGKIKRHEILLAAIEVFSRRGYRQASIREIAESVGITHAGIFHYFASKEELFVEVLRMRDEISVKRDADVLEALRLHVQHNVQVEGLVHLFVTVSAEAIDDSHPGHEYFRKRYELVVDQLKHRILEGQGNGKLSAKVDPLTASQMLVALVDGLQVQWLFDPDNTNMIRIFDTFCNVLLGGLSPENAEAQASTDIG